MSKEINTIFSKRLRQARIMRGLSLEALSNAVNNSVSRQSINKYEQGKMMPDSCLLIRLASALDVKVDFFFRPFSVSVGQVDFRKKSRFSDANAAALKERVQEELERYLEIEQMSKENKQFLLPKKNVTSLEEARLLAKEVREQCQLGKDGISNVIEVLEDYGIKVIEVQERESFDGLSGYANNCIPVIVVNALFKSERKRFTALHELGHLLMVFPEGINPKDAESFCNAFANEVLLPFSVILKRIGDKRHDISLSELTDIQRQYGISVDAIMFSLHQHGVISDNRYKTFNIKKATNPIFKEEVQKSRIGHEQSHRFIRMVYRALADGLISMSKAASLLNWPINRVQEQLQLI